MRNALLAVLRRIDRRFAAASLSRRPEGPALIAFTIHTLCADEREARAGTLAPFHPVLLSDLARMVDHFLGHGYRFVAPSDIAAGLERAGRYVWLTFDDGYANNLRALALLEERRVPATFFVSTGHVADGKAYWWDALYRERTKRGVGLAAIRSEQEALKQRPTREIEAHVRNEFGRSALDPVSDLDRPMTAAELASMGAHPCATLGNHTTDHALLTLEEDEAARAQIRGCQEFLGASTGRVPEAIAYPDGRFDERVVRLSRAEGLRLGAVTVRGKNRLPIAGDAAMRIRRFSLASGPALDEQFLLCRSDIGIVKLLRRFNFA